MKGGGGEGVGVVLVTVVVGLNSLFIGYNMGYFGHVCSRGIMAF